MEDVAPVQEQLSTPPLPPAWTHEQTNHHPPMHRAPQKSMASPVITAGKRSSSVILARFFGRRSWAYGDECHWCIPRRRRGALERTQWLKAPPRFALEGRAPGGPTGPA